MAAILEMTPLKKGTENYFFPHQNFILAPKWSQNSQKLGGVFLFRLDIVQPYCAGKWHFLH